jgi:hypothetical protein
MKFLVGIAVFFLLALAYGDYRWRRWVTDRRHDRDRRE